MSTQPGYGRADVSILPDTVLLLAACVDPRGMPDAIADPRRREAEYAAVLRYYLTQHPRIPAVLFVENSGWPLDALRAEAAACATTPVEFLSFEGNDFPREFDKGFGEHRLLRYAVDHSESARKFPYIAKMTGRHYLTNLSDILARVRGPLKFLCDLRDHPLYEWLRLPQHCGRHCDTRFFVFAPEFFRRNLYTLTDAHAGGAWFIERHYYDAVKPRTTESSSAADCPSNRTTVGQPGIGAKITPRGAAVRRNPPEELCACFAPGSGFDLVSTSLSIVIPTCGRDGVLVDTIGSLLTLSSPADELLVIDQSPRHDPDTDAALSRWHANGAIRWIRQQHPSLVRAINRGLLDARGDIVLILDDDIIPCPELVAAHAAAYAAHPRAWAVVGQVLQPGETPETPTDPVHRPGLWDSLDFPFRSTQGAWIANAIACNLSVRRDKALAVGGFDERFVPPVAYRFETEFARRVIAHGGAIRFEPHASVRHLRAGAGGTRHRGGHLASASPLHGCGDYYFALRCGSGWDRAAYMARRPFREICTRFHLRHPWWIPVKFVGELRALGMAMRLCRQGPKLLLPPTPMTDSCSSGSGAAALPQPETGAGSRAAPCA